MRPRGVAQRTRRSAAAVRVTRAGLLTRSLAMLGALGGSAAAAAELGASPASQPSPARDRQILRFGLLIERIQAAFYAEALRAGRLTAENRQLAEIVGKEEQAHVRYMAAALGSSAGRAPRFRFGDAVTDPAKFVATAVSLEDTGLAVYNGQGANLTPAALAGTARLVSVEARHAAWARALAGELPAPVAVDVPVTLTQANAILRPFLA